MGGSRIAIPVSALILATGLSLGCASAPDLPAPSPVAAMCIDFEDFQEGQLPAGWLMDAPASDGEVGLHIAPARGVDGGRGVQLRTSKQHGGALWLQGVRCRDAVVEVRVRAIEPASRLGIVFDLDAVDAMSIRPRRRCHVAWLPGEASVAMVTTGDDYSREVLRLPVDGEAREWHRLEIERIGSDLEIRFDGRSIRAPLVLGDAEAVGVGIEVRGAGVFDAFCIR
ncbi:MAG: hypothetical protein KDC95_04075 [Planctomycetes bacterium]|nr:hypothetical protein [Planctomycetota bacterium]